MSFLTLKCFKKKQHLILRRVFISGLFQVFMCFCLKLFMWVLKVFILFSRCFASKIDFWIQKYIHCFLATNIWSPKIPVVLVFFSSKYS